MYKITLEQRVKGSDTVHIQFMSFSKSPAVDLYLVNYLRETVSVTLLHV